MAEILDVPQLERPKQTHEAIVRFFAGDEFDFEAQLILRREEVPPCELGGTGDAAPQLGWVSWSKSRSRHSCACCCKSAGMASARKVLPLSSAS